MDSNDRPIPAVGVLVFQQGRVLMVKRARSPNKGLWTIPGGKINKGESLHQAAQREVLEETGLLVSVKYPIYCFDLIAPDKSQYLIVDVLADLVGGDARAGSDALELSWFTPQELDTGNGVEANSRRLVQSWYKLDDTMTQHCFATLYS